MKINNAQGTNTIVNQNSREQVEKQEGTQQEKQGQIKNGSLKASELNIFQDPIEEKKKKAMEEAMGFIKDQFKSDGQIDQIKDECRDEIKKSKDLAKEASQELSEIRKQQQELKEQYKGVEDDDYRAQMKALNDEADEWKKQYDEAHQVISAATAGIKSIKQEELKHHGMVDAGKNAEASLKASSDEIIGMIKDEAIDKIDKDLEETVEEAKEDKEEKVKEEAEKEAARAEREQQAQEVEENLQEQKKRANRTSNSLKNISVSELLDKQQDINRNTQQILEEQKLLQEEIKGIVVDSQV